MSKSRNAFVTGLVCSSGLAFFLGGSSSGDGSTRPLVVFQKGKSVASSTSKKSAVLDRLRDKNRPVVVFGSKADDAKVTKQRHSWAGALPEAGVKDRDIIVVEVLAQGESKVGGEALKPEEARELRQLFSVGEEAFAVVLIGRDGGEKVRWTEPVSAQEIFGKIDAMPMRQQEVQTKGGGSE